MTAGQWLEFDVTAYVTGNGLVSFGFMTDQDANGLDLLSKESADPPVLEIVH